MNIKFEKFDSGWVGLSLAVSPEEIAVLQLRLRELVDGNIQHFHIRSSDFDGEAGVADIEITLIGSTELDNMTID